MSISDERLRDIIKCGADSDECVENGNGATLRAMSTELLFLRASSNAKAREESELRARQHELEQFRSWVCSTPDRTAAHKNIRLQLNQRIAVLRNKIAALPPSPRATQGGEAEQA